MPSRHGRSALITGTGGLGHQGALALARAGGEVIIAGRNPAKGAEAVARIRQSIPNAIVRFEVLDLANLRSVADFAARLRADREGIDLLINNAAVMMPPRRLVTSDGFDLQFGTNLRSHFALTAHLLPLLRQGRAPCVVTVFSFANRTGAMDFDDLQSGRGYRPMVAYGQLKPANVLFSFELQRRSERRSPMPDKGFRIVQAGVTPYGIGAAWLFLLQAAPDLEPAGLGMQLPGYPCAYQASEAWARRAWRVHAICEGLAHSSPRDGCAGREIGHWLAPLDGYAPLGGTLLRSPSTLT